MATDKEYEGYQEEILLDDGLEQYLLMHFEVPNLQKFKLVQEKSDKKPKLAPLTEKNLETFNQDMRVKTGKSGDQEMKTAGSCQANTERSSVVGKELETPELPKDKNRLQSVKLVVNDSNSSLSANED